MTTVLGIDEAGRGPVIGPMIICGYLVESSKISKLKSIGVKDSKLLSPRTRERIANELKTVADDFILINISAEEIDKLRTQTNLNKIEIEKMQQIINLLSPDEVVIDSPETDCRKFEQKIRSKLKNKDIKIVAENYADKKYVVVGAASIMAKVVRDKAIEKIKRDYNVDFNSGYTSDEKTIDFLKKWFEIHNEFPPFVRKSWITVKMIKKDHEQIKIIEFLKNHRPGNAVNGPNIAKEASKETT